MTLLDAYCLIALLRDEPAAEEVGSLLRGGGCALTAANLAEVVDFCERRQRIPTLEVRRQVEPLLGRIASVVSIEAAHGWRAGALRARYYERRRRSLSLADCLLLACAGPGDRVATSDGPLAAAARAEGIEVVALPDSRGTRP